MSFVFACYIGKIIFFLMILNLDSDGLNTENIDYY